jgi:hypothetical protein
MSKIIALVKRRLPARFLLYHVWRVHSRKSACRETPEAEEAWLKRVSNEPGR